MTDAFDKAFGAAARIREIVEGDISVLLDKIDHQNETADGPKDKVEALTSDEVQKLLLALGRSPSEFSEKDAERLVDWAKEIRINAAMLDLILEGRAVPSVDADGDVTLVAVEVQS